MPDVDPIPAEETTPTEAPPAEVTQEHDPMLDVHPAHHAASTWKDFFIHIATIVIGLIIAVSLEQGVEYIHHRRELAEARKELATERKINIDRFAVQTEELHRFVPILQNNLAIFVYLRQHPGKPVPASLGAVRWATMTTAMLDSAWTAAQHSGAVDYMRHSEARIDGELYVRLNNLNQQIRDARVTYGECLRYRTIDPDPEHMSPDQLDREIDQVSRALLAVRTVATVMRNAHTQFPDFAPAPSDADFLAITHGTPTPSAGDKLDHEATIREMETYQNYERSLDQSEGTE